MNKIAEEGLIVGKFYPLHKGHQFLIETALKKVKHLTVLLCHTPKYQIDPEIRAGWIRDLYPMVTVILFRHDKKLDSTSPEMSPVWAKITIDLLGFAPDIVFSSEDYGETYATCMGSKHILVDKLRTNFPVSGTIVRSDPNKAWDFLSETVRAYYAKRVVILGAESTGTTTLAGDLARYYHTVWVPEYGRIYSEGKATSDQVWTTGEFIHISSVQTSMENTLARKCNRILICDTDAFATRLWHERYLGHMEPRLDTMANTNNKNLYILTGDEIPFVQDGLRDGEHIRHHMHMRFIQELKSHNLRYITVSGSREKRLNQSVYEIDKLIPLI